MGEQAGGADGLVRAPVADVHAWPRPSCHGSFRFSAARCRAPAEERRAGGALLTLGPGRRCPVDAWGADRGSVCSVRLAQPGRKNGHRHVDHRARWGASVRERSSHVGRWRTSVGAATPYHRAVQNWKRFRSWTFIQNDRWPEHDISSDLRQYVTNNAESFMAFDSTGSPNRMRFRRAHSIRSPPRSAWRAPCVPPIAGCDEPVTFAPAIDDMPVPPGLMGSGMVERARGDSWCGGSKSVEGTPHGDGDGTAPTATHTRRGRRAGWRVQNGGFPSHQQRPARQPG